MPCPSRDLCIRSVKEYKRRRTVTVRIREHYEALKMAREREETADFFLKQYAERAGIEGTISRAIRTCDARRCRYIGLTKTHLQHLLSAASLSFLRVGEWIAGVPKAITRLSPFAKLMALPTTA